MAMENGPCIGNFPMKLSIHRKFSTAMFDYQRAIDVDLDIHLVGGLKPSEKYERQLG